VKETTETEEKNSRGRGNQEENLNDQAKKALKRKLQRQKKKEQKKIKAS
jgi:hypothetical protein